MKIFSRFGLLISLLFVSGALIQAQERYVVSARAGIVNFITGQASVTRASGSQASLIRQDTIEAGDIASTDDGGYAEILLNPGSYLRLGPNSRFRFGSTSLEDTSVEMLAGSAIFEINADNAFSIAVTTPSATLHLDRSGIYRVDLEPPPGELEVLKGSSFVGSTEVKAGRMLRLEPGAIPEKFDPKAMDALALWSDSRAKELARITNAVQAQALNNALATSYYLNAWDFLPSRPGLWIWDHSFGCGFFLPFGSRHHSHWSYRYYLNEPFNWNRYGWRERRDHPREFKTAPGKTEGFTGNKEHHPKPTVRQAGTDPSGIEQRRQPNSDKSTRDAKARSDRRVWTRGGSDSTHSRGGSSGSGGAQSGGGDNSHHTWTGGSRSGGSSGGSSSGSSGGSRSSGGSSGSNGGGSGGSRSSGSSNSGGSGGSHSIGGSSSGSSGSSGSKSSPSSTKTVKD